MEKLRDQIQKALTDPVEVDESKVRYDKYPDEKKARDTYIGEVKNKRVRDIRAKAVKDAFDNHRGKNERGELTIRSRKGGEVTLTNVKYVEYDGVSCVEIWGDDGAVSPSYRIFNPPTLVEDGLGDVEVRGKKYREDPLGALAEVLASNSAGKKVRR